MGLWGVALSSSDTYLDVYDSFYELFNANTPADEIVLRLEKGFEDVLSEPDDAPDFVFAVCKAIWEIGAVSEKYWDKLSEIVATESEVDRWIRLDGSQRDAIKRHNNAVSLLEKIQVKNPRPKRPKKIRLVDSYFEKGDCLSFKDADGYYSGAVVLSAEKQSEFGLNLVLVLDYSSELPPTVDDFKNGNCAMVTDLKGGYRPWTLYCYAKDVKRVNSEISRVGQIDITIDYPYQTLGHSFGSWNLISDWMRVKAVNDKQIPKKSAKSMYKKGLFNW